MSANIHGKMVYSFDKPMWHNITEPSKEPMYAEEILDNRFGGGIQIHLRPLHVMLNGEQVETKDFAIVRSPSPEDNKGEIVFGYCTERYHPLQPRDVARSFDMNVNEYVETFGFLGDGQEMFISWVMPSIEVRTGDELELYGIVRVGYDTTKGPRLFTSVYRPVCANTINMAEGWAQRNTDGAGKGRIWKGKQTNKNLLRDLGYWMAHVQNNALREKSLLEGFFGKLASTPIKTDVEAHEILFESFPPREDVSKYYPEQLKDKKQEAIESYNEGQSKLRDGIYELFAGAGTAITPDYYGLLNSTSEYFCHVQPSKKPIAESVMFGNRQSNIMDVVNVLNKRVQ